MGWRSYSDFPSVREMRNVRSHGEAPRDRPACNGRGHDQVIGWPSATSTATSTATVAGLGSGRRHRLGGPDFVLLAAVCYTLTSPT